MRLVAVSLVGRLSARNPAAALPPLRALLLELLMEMGCAAASAREGGLLTLRGGGGGGVGGRAFEVREKDLSRLLSRYLFFCAHRTHFSHMSHPTFPTSHLLFLFFKFLFFAHPLLSRLGVTAPQLLEPYADAVRAVKLPFQPPPIQSHPDSKPP